MSKDRRAVTKAERIAILREVAEQPLVDVHPNLEAARIEDGGARLQWMRDLADELEAGEPIPRMGNIFAEVLARDPQPAPPPTGLVPCGQPDCCEAEQWTRACAAGDCWYADSAALKPDDTKTCPGHRGRRGKDCTMRWPIGHCPRRAGWGEIHEQSGRRTRPIREPGEEG